MLWRVCTPKDQANADEGIFSVVSTYVHSHENSTNKGNFQQPYKLAKKGSSEIQNCTVRFSTCSGRIKQLGLNFLEQFYFYWINFFMQTLPDRMVYLLLNNLK